MRNMLLLSWLLLPLCFGVHGTQAGTHCVDHPSGAHPLVRVIDGDTIQIGMAGRLPLPLADHLGLRLLGVDTPEVLHANCPAERDKGLLATRFVEDLLGNTPPEDMGVRICGWDKYAPGDFGRGDFRLTQVSGPPAGGCSVTCSSGGRDTETGGIISPPPCPPCCWPAVSVSRTPAMAASLRGADDRPSLYLSLIPATMRCDAPGAMLRLPRRADDLVVVDTEAFLSAGDANPMATLLCHRLCPGRGLTSAFQVLLQVLGSEAVRAWDGGHPGSPGSSRLFVFQARLAAAVPPDVKPVALQLVLADDEAENAEEEEDEEVTQVKVAVQRWSQNRLPDLRSATLEIVCHDFRSGGIHGSTVVVAMDASTSPPPPPHVPVHEWCLTHSSRSHTVMPPRVRTRSGMLRPLSVARWERFFHDETDADACHAEWFMHDSGPLAADAWDREEYGAFNILYNPQSGQVRKEDQATFPVFFFLLPSLSCLPGSGPCSHGFPCDPSQEWLWIVCHTEAHENTEAPRGCCRPAERHLRPLPRAAQVSSSQRNLPSSAEELVDVLERWLSDTRSEAAIQWDANRLLRVQRTLDNLHASRDPAVRLHTGDVPFHGVHPTKEVLASLVPPALRLNVARFVPAYRPSFLGCPAQALPGTPSPVSRPVSISTTTQKIKYGWSSLSLSLTSLSVAYRLSYQHLLALAMVDA